MSEISVQMPSAYGLGDAVTPHDTNEIDGGACRALYIGGTGNLVVTMARGGDNVTLNSVPVGILPISVIRVLNTGTTATDIVALR